MIKVMVVIFGLVLFVPSTDFLGNEELSALFVDGGSDLDSHDQLHDHIPKWASATGRRTVGRWSAIEVGRDSRIELRSSPGHVSTAAQSEFFTLSRILDSPRRARVRDRCRRNRSRCRTREREDPVRLALKFEGEWSTRSATYCCGFHLPIGKGIKPEVELRRRVGQDGFEAHPWIREREVATALVLETEVDELSDLTRGTPFELSELSRKECAQWFPEDGDEKTPERCAVLLVGSLPDEYGACQGSACRWDDHFAALYRPAQDPPVLAERWLPYNLSDQECAPQVSGPVSCPGPNGLEPPNFPSSICPPMFAPPD